MTKLLRVVESVASDEMVAINSEQGPSTAQEPCSQVVPLSRPESFQGASMIY
jgi:hypothetical protein